MMSRDGLTAWATQDCSSAEVRQCRICCTMRHISIWDI